MSCDGIEREPSTCRCPCQGCRHHCSAHRDDDAEGTAPAPPQPTGSHPAERYTATPEQAAEALAYWEREQLESRPCPYDGMYGPHDHIPGADSEVCLVTAQPNREQHDVGAADITIFTACRRWFRRLGDWLDPHAEHRREYRELQREWARQFRTDLDGGDAGTEGGKR